MLQFDAKPFPWPAELAEWFLAEVDRLSREPFELGPGERVPNPDLFFSWMARDVAAGPASPRARRGALQHDLARLHQRFCEVSTVCT